MSRLISVLVLVLVLLVPVTATGVDVFSFGRYFHHEPYSPPFWNDWFSFSLTLPDVPDCYPHCIRPAGYDCTAIHASIYRSYYTFDWTWCDDGWVHVEVYFVTPDSSYSSWRIMRTGRYGR